LVRTLFLEYASSLGFDSCFEDFESELQNLPGEYAPPAGALMLAFEKEQAAGCIALRRINDDTCEMKRLYVRPAFRGKGFGRQLTIAVTEKARKIGYTRIRLNTLPTLKEAISLYRSLGFKEIKPYTHNHVEGSHFMELEFQSET
jgi:ribosomal protein S18 acetylase RimI-like enzyme